MAIDSNVPIDPKALVAAGVADIGRYLHTLTRAEVDGYHAHGIRVWLIWELLAGAALGGAGQGAIDAQGALRAIAALGKPAPPPGVAVYFAWDADPGNPADPRGLEYFRTTGTIMRQAACRNGSYAGAPAQLAGFGAGTIDFAWGPGATSWDHGLSVPGRVLQQLAVYDVVAGIPVDADVRSHTVLADDYGAWAPPTPVTPPPIVSKENVMLSTVAVAGPDGSPTAARYLVAVDPAGASLPQALPIKNGGDLQAWQALGAKPAGPGVALSQEALDAITPAKG